MRFSTIFAMVVSYCYIQRSHCNPWETTNQPNAPACPNTCGKGEKICECFLTITHNLTMMDDRERVIPKSGKLYKYNNLNVPVSDRSDIMSLDGQTSRIVISVNKQFPGPTITAFEGQEMIIHVRNLMHTDSTTIHWHGMVQKGSPYADGVASVSQCPILPGHTFTYRYTASPHGTSFYHAHIGDQRTMGLYGPLIIYKKNRDEPQEPNEFVAIIQDWNHNEDAETLYQRMLLGNFRGSGNSFNKKSTTNSTDGSMFSQYWMHSGIINGKGRFYTSRKTFSHNGAPLTVFDVYEGREYRIRVISAATLYPFRVYVEGHPIIRLVASDGYDLVPMDVESFIIHPGERYDFLLTTKTEIKQNEPGEYLLVAESIETEESLRGIDEYHAAEAIIRYKSTATITDNLKRKGPNVCTAAKPCIVFNCPYLYYPKSKYTICKTYNDARSNDPNSDVKTVTGPVETLFFNFAFPGRSGKTPGSVNGRQFLPPNLPALLSPTLIETGCSNEECGPNKVCECSYSVDIHNGKIYQFVLTNLGKGSGWSHPVHLHGHSFYVMKAGFGAYDETTGVLTKNSEDTFCEDEYCNVQRWNNSAWENDINIDGFISENPAQKDTIIVPTGGYVIIRFKADNPGPWFFHCHIDLHNTNGMALIVNESFSSYPVIPNEVLRCESFSVLVDRLKETISDEAASLCQDFVNVILGTFVMMTVKLF